MRVTLPIPCRACDDYVDDNCGFWDGALAEIARVEYSRPQNANHAMKQLRLLHPLGPLLVPEAYFQSLQS